MPRAFAILGADWFLRACKRLIIAEETAVIPSPTMGAPAPITPPVANPIPESKAALRDRSSSVLPRPKPEIAPSAPPAADPTAALLIMFPPRLPVPPAVINLPKALVAPAPDVINRS